MSNKLNKKDILYLAVLIVCMGMLMILYTRFKYVYGSKMDWESQHSVLPDYFRKLFYQTKKILPSFAPNIGAGQNIYYFSYYGLFSPVILLSYLLPFITMKNYIIATSIINVGASVILIYIWLRSRYSQKLSFIAAFLFLCSGPLVFHSHRHIMFINYLPFLIILLICIDRFKNKKNMVLIPALVFLLIMTSYFFSFSSLIFLTVYTVALYFENRKTSSDIKHFAAYSAKYATYIIIGVMMAGILLMPTIYVLITGRGAQGLSGDYKQMLLPGLNLENILYSPYAVGVSFIGVTAFLSGLYSENIRTRILAFTVVLPMVFSVFIYLLNGTLYVDGKVMIPFLPFAVMLICEMLENIKTKKYFYIVVGIAALWCILNLVYKNMNKYIPVFSCDAVITILSLVWVRKKGIKIYRMAPVLVMTFLLCVFVNRQDTVIEKNKKDEMISADAASVADLISKDDQSLYRTANMIKLHENVNMVYNTDYYQPTVYSSASNKDYHKFYSDNIGNETRYRNSSIMSQTPNVLFNLYMGSKYLLSTGSAPVGYSFKSQQNDVMLYENDSAFPLAYSSGKKMSLREYSKLSYPQNLEAMMRYAVVDDDSIPASQYISDVKAWTPEYNLNKDISGQVNLNNGDYNICTDKKLEFSADLKDPLENQIIFIRFHIDITNNSADQDVYIMINGVKNKISAKNWKYFNDNEWFEYVISSDQKIDKLNITLSPGNYTVSDAEMFTLDYSTLSGLRNTFDTMKIQEKDSESISGTIDMRDDGYLQMSVPYDKGFSIYADGVQVKCIKVDNSFIGCYLGKGPHNIKVVFRSPYLTHGIVCSLTGFVLFGTEVVLMRRKKPVRYQLHKKSA